MPDLQKIRAVSQRYNITPRTLRYYEEVGLLRSERADESGYRSYDAEALDRLAQILLLRRMELSMRDIEAIFASRDLKVAVETFERKLRAISEQMAGLAELKETVTAFLSRLRERGFDKADGLRLLLAETAAPQVQPSGQDQQRPAVKEESRMQESLTHVRIIELKPMQVAYYRHESTSPENDGWAVMKEWAEAKGLHHLPTTRLFGFNNPGPTPGNPVYGYEFWITVPEGTTAEGAIGIKRITGGLYAVINSCLPEIGERWQSLAQWVTAHDGLSEGTHQCLEESTSPWDSGPGDLQLDLMFPIIRK